MPDLLAPTDFEHRLADELARHAAMATDPRPTRLIAAEAMRLGRRRSWAWPRPRARLLGLAAILLLPLALALAGAGALLRQDTADGARALVVRPVGAGLDVIVADPEGHERLLRHLTPDDLGLGPQYELELSGHVSPSGWLEVNGKPILTHDGPLTEDDPPLRAAFVDLADPTRPPIVVLGSGFVGVRWGPDGRAALVCGPDPDCGQLSGADRNWASRVRVLDLETGSETIVHGVQLHGGTPEPIWSEDGSGFLFRFEDGSWGVTPLEGGPVVPGAPRILSRHLRLEPTSAGAMPELTDAGTVARQWLGDQLAPAVPVAGTNAADGNGIWLLLDEMHGAQHQAVLAKLTDPGEIISIRRFDVPGPVTGFAMSDDDSVVALDLGDDPWRFVLAPMSDGAPVTATGPVIDGIRIGLVPATEVEGWPGG